MADVQILAQGVKVAPLNYAVNPSVELVVKALYASFDGTGAADAFLPAVRVLSPAGQVVGEYVTDTPVAAGSSAEVSWAPFLRNATPAGGVIPPPVPVIGYDAYASYAAGTSGSFVVPATAKMLQVVCVGAGGGGGGGFSSATTPVRGAGGGGGGAVSLAWWDAERLTSLYPTGVPFSVGTGGNAGAVAGSGDNGGATTFGTQSGGGGGGGRRGSVNNDQGGGGGGGITSANLSTGGTPAGATASLSFGLQGCNGTASNSGGTASGEYGGGAGGQPFITSGANGGNSLWGGGGGGAGGAYNPSIEAGGKGGTSGVYLLVSTQGGGTGNQGTLTGLWAGSGGDGGASTGASSNGLPGQAGSIAGGGGGGASSNSGQTPGIGGKGGDGVLFIYILG